jgi:hypothetical protein
MISQVFMDKDVFIIRTIYIVIRSGAFLTVRIAQPRQRQLNDLTALRTGRKIVDYIRNVTGR